MNIKQKNNLVVATMLVFGTMLATLLVSSPAQADSFSAYAQCADDSTEVTMSTKTKKIEGVQAKVVTIACKSGSKLKYTDLNSAKKRIHLTYKCAGGESEQPVPNKTGDGKVTVYCQTVSSKSADHVTTKPTTTEPEVTSKVAKSVDEINENNGNEDGELANPIAGNDCGGVETAIIKCDEDNSGGIENNGVWALLILVLNILTAGVGIVAVGGIVYGAILYTTAEDKADQVKKATDIITNVVIGLIAFALMWSLLNFIVPGGVFN